MKYKVKLTDPNSFYRKFDNGTEIGGSFGEPKVLIISLNEKEKDCLNACIGIYPNSSCNALWAFMNSYCTQWHKRLIINKFKYLNKIKIEWQTN